MPSVVCDTSYLVTCDSVTRVLLKIHGDSGTDVDSVVNLVRPSCGTSLVVE